MPASYAPTAAPTRQPSPLPTRAPSERYVVNVERVVVRASVWEMDLQSGAKVVGSSPPSAVCTVLLFLSTAVSTRPSFSKNVRRAATAGTAIFGFLHCKTGGIFEPRDHRCAYARYDGTGGGGSWVAGFE